MTTVGRRTPVQQSITLDTTTDKLVNHSIHCTMQVLAVAAAITVVVVVVAVAVL